MSDEATEPRVGKTVSVAPGGDGHAQVSADLQIVIASGCVGGNYSTLVGKRVTLAVYDANNNLVTGRWYIPNATAPSDPGDYDAIKGWDCEFSDRYPSSSPDVHLLEDHDFNSSNIRLFWVKPGKKVIVFTATGHGAATVNRTITVNAPTVRARGATSSVAVRRYGTTTRMQFGLGDVSPRRGDRVPGEWPGIRFEYAIQPPQGGDGKICGIQLIKNATTVGDNAGVAHKHRFDDYALDTILPYAQPSTAVATKSGTWQPWVHPEGSYDNGLGTYADNFDSPGFPLDPGWTTLNADERFKMFLMYRPDGDSKDTVWVTLSSIEWGWTGSAADLGSGWSGNGSPSASTVATNKLPTWSRRFEASSSMTDWEPPLTFTR
ncbi:MAG: hypothetical protein U0414_39145 [Polyangiaceae bacterium]